MWEAIIVGVLSLCGTLGGAYLANKKSSALIAYRLEQLEEKVNKHNGVIERTYAIEQRVSVDEEKLKVTEHRLSDLEDYHK